MSAKVRSLDDFLLLLKGVKPGKDGQFTALCPGHDDRNQSLSVKQADGKLLLKCFAGCETADILKPLGLDTKDLFLHGHNPKAEKRVIEAVYHYEGFEVVRTRPKGFYQRRPDGKGGYVNNLKSVTLSLYRQAELKEAIDGGKAIYVAEGEKDVDRLRAEGFTATCNPMGAGKWREPYSEALRGADLVIIPDNDGPGHDHAAQVARSCYGKAARIRVLELPGDVKDVSDWLAIGHAVGELTQLASQCPEYKPPAETTLPEIVVTDRHLRDITADALDALYKANKPERIFRRSSALTRISVDETARPFTEAVSESALRGYLARSCNFVRILAKDDRVAVPPPLDVVRDIGSLGDWQFPPLLGITEAPVIRPDGTVMNKPGYDSATNLYYFPSLKLVVLPIPDEPTESDVKAAIELALEPVCDFPFDSEASRANALATMFTPILRPMIDGPVPLALFDKPQQGTGASLLAEVISLIATGRAAAMMTAQKDDEGWRKAITSLLIKGQLVVTIDNVEYDLFTPSLAAILTATSYQDRILGRSEMVILPNRTTWVATGNNIRLRGDLPRRCIWVRMDAKTARPWQRDISRFKHPRLIEWASTNRGGILAAILTIARAWVVAGMPEPKGLPNLGGYESYCRIVGGVLAYMGVNGFLANLDVMYAEMDTETPQWEAFLQNWYETVGNKAVTAAEFISHINDNAELRAALPDVIADTSLKNYTRRLGNALAKKKGVRFPNGYSVLKTDKGKYGATWQVVTPGVTLKKESHQAKLAMDGDSGDSSPNPSRMQKQDGGNKYTHKNGVGNRVTESPSATKTGDSGSDDNTGGLPVSNADMTKIDPEWREKILPLWESERKPVIHLGPGENCFDLAQLLSHGTVKSSHLVAVLSWMDSVLRRG